MIDLLVYNANGVLNLSTRHIIFLIGHIDILDVDSEMGSPIEITVIEQLW